MSADAGNRSDRRVPSRREFLGTTGAALGGLCLASLVQACGTGSTAPSGASTQFKNVAPEALAANLVFLAGNYKPPVVEGYLRRFKETYPKVQVDYQVVSGGVLHDKEVAILNGGGAVPNLFYVGDDWFRSFIDAKYIQPIDGFPGADQYLKDFTPATKQALTWKGKLYGLPYYSSIYCFSYFAPLLQQAGITHPPVNLSELKDQCLEIKRAGLSDYPLMLPFILNAGTGDFAFWSMLYSSGAEMFDKDFNPVFHKSGSAAEQIVAWFVDAMNTWKILQPSALQTINDDVIKSIAPGKVAFAPLNDLYLKQANIGPTATRPGAVKMAPFPGLTPTSHGTVGWTRSYSIPSKATDIEASWALLQYVGGQPAAGPDKGQYYAARSWFLSDGLGYGFAPLAKDPAVVADLGKWVDTAIFEREKAAAKARQNILTPWYFAWTTFFQQKVQEALGKQITATQVMQQLKTKTDELRKQFGD